MGKKQDIQNAALILLVQKGIHATPMSAIAKEAGTGMGTIYNHFPNKDLLINTLYVDIKKAEKAVFKTFDEQKSLKTQFEEYYLNAIQFYLDKPLYFHFIEQIHASPLITKESREIAYQSITEVLELIEKGKRERVIKNIATNDLMQFIGGTIISFLRLYFEENRQERSYFTNQIIMVWDAIKE